MDSRYWRTSFSALSDVLFCNIKSGGYCGNVDTRSASKSLLRAFKV